MGTSDGGTSGDEATTPALWWDLALAEASRQGRALCTPVHLAIGVLSLQDPQVDCILQRMSLDADELVHHLRQALPTGPKAAAAEPSSACRQAVARARAIDPTAGPTPAHLLLALLAEPNRGVGTALRHGGLELRPAQRAYESCRQLTEAAHPPDATA